MSRRLFILPGRFAVCRLAADDPPPAWLFHPGSRFHSLTRTEHELSIVCAEDDLPPSVTTFEAGWRMLALEGPIPFTAAGVLDSILGPLADAGVPIFALSTYDTDLVLVKEADLARALAALRDGFEIEERRAGA